MMSEWNDDFERQERSDGEDDLFAENLDDIEDERNHDQWRLSVAVAIRGCQPEKLSQALRERERRWPKHDSLGSFLGKIPLNEAAGASQHAREMTELLLAAGADLYSVDRNGDIPLTIALKANNEAVPALLAATDCNKLSVMAGDGTPLMKAALEGNLGWARTLLPRSDPNQRSGSALYGQTAFEMACLAREDAVAKELAPVSDMWRRDEHNENRSNAHAVVQQGLDASARAAGVRLIEQNEKEAFGEIERITQAETGRILTWAAQHKDETIPLFRSVKEKLQDCVSALEVWASEGWIGKDAEANLLAAVIAAHLSAPLLQARVEARQLKAAMSESAQEKPQQNTETGVKKQSVSRRI